MSTMPPDAPPQAPPPPGPLPGPSGDNGPRVTRDEVRDLGRLRRTVGAQRKVAGVAGGLARHLDIDPVIVRVALVVLAFFGGAGVLVYAACWLLVPEDGKPRAAINLDDRNRGIALTVVGAIAVLCLLGDSIGQWGFPWPLVVIGVVALLVLTLFDRNRERRPVTAPPVPHTVDPQTGQVLPVVPAPAPWPAATPSSARPPRRRGPILFWFTMALAAISAGGLAIADLAGASVLPSAYPAVVVAACGLMLLVGAFYGRAGGIALVGVLASLALLVASVLGSWHGTGDRTTTPETASQVSDSYRLTAGQEVLDLTRVADLQALDGRTIHLTVRTGRIEVIVPPGLAARVHAENTGAGHIVLFGEEWDGWNPKGSAYRAGSSPLAPAITIDATVTFGEIDVHTEGGAR